MCNNREMKNCQFAFVRNGKERIVMVNKSIRNFIH